MPRRTGENYVFREGWQHHATAVLPAYRELRNVPWSFRTERPHPLGVSDLSEFHVRRPGGALFIFRRLPTGWIRKGRPDQKPDDQILDTIAAGLSAMRAAVWEPVGDGSPGPDAFALSLELRPFERAARQFWVGAPGAGGARQVRDGDSRWVLQLRLVDRHQDVFRMMEAVLDELGGDNPAARARGRPTGASRGLR